MVQAVSRRLLILAAWALSQASRCGVCGAQSVSGTGFSPSTSFSSCQHHCTNSLYPSVDLSLTLGLIM